MAAANRMTAVGDGWFVSGIVYARVLAKHWVFKMRRTTADDQAVLRLVAQHPEVQSLFYVEHRGDKSVEPCVLGFVTFNFKKRAVSWFDAFDLGQPIELQVAGSHHHVLTTALATMKRTSDQERFAKCFATKIGRVFS